MATAVLSDAEGRATCPVFGIGLSQESEIRVRCERNVIWAFGIGPDRATVHSPIARHVASLDVRNKSPDVGKRGREVRIGG